ncbi:peroxidase [Lithospermum erythrorhizon]|uniref:peroxidase n=1 Tax=Lithospermum erythrorhizon TaxID=34254 RepID=A0AAV3R196_LITER
MFTCTFVFQGCDASILLRGSPSLRALTLKAIRDLGNILHKECGRVVSCADIITICTRDAIFLAGGPDYSVPLGRRDSLVSLPPPKNNTKLPFPPPSSNTTTNLNYFAQHNFDATDVVAISGSHTFGRSRCFAVKSRLYPTVDPTMDPKFAKTVGKTCDSSNSTNNATVLMDTLTSKIFDNKHYVNIMNHKVLFNTDQDLLNDVRTKYIVTSFAKNQSLFFEKFVNAIVKMGQMGVLIGNQGEIRSNCSLIAR